LGFIDWVVGIREARRVSVGVRSNYFTEICSGSEAGSYLGFFYSRRGGNKEEKKNPTRGEARSETKALRRLEFRVWGVGYR